MLALRRFALAALLLAASAVAMAQTTLLTIPQTTLSLGVQSFQTASINSAFSQYILTLNEVSWPLAGDKVMDMTVDYSPDNGATWIFISSSDVYDDPVPAFHGFPANAIRFVVTIPDVGSSTRKLRATFNVVKSVTVTGSLAAK